MGKEIKVEWYWDCLWQRRRISV